MVALFISFIIYIVGIIIFYLWDTFFGWFGKDIDWDKEEFCVLEAALFWPIALILIFFSKFFDIFNNVLNFLSGIKRRRLEVQKENKYVEAQNQNSRGF